MTRYYIDISTELLESKDELLLPEGFRFVERWGPKGLECERWIVEDDDAGAEFEGHLIELSFRREDGSERPRISERAIRGI